MVTITDKRVVGSIKGRETGAVVLVTSLGGTGSFFELALLSKGTNGWENTDTILLGDRVKVYSVRIENDLIVVAMTTHGSNDPALLSHDGGDKALYRQGQPFCACR